MFQFAGTFRPSGDSSAYDIHPDGSRVIMVSEAQDRLRAPRQINIVANWFEELKRLAGSSP